MKLFSYGKDGGDESTVWGFWLAEIKSLFSIVVLCFEDGSRDAFHSHAFHSISWVLSGRLVEQHLSGRGNVHGASWRPVVTYRDTFHKVKSEGRSWVLSFRGPWSRTWEEFRPGEQRFVTLQSGRTEV